MTEGDGVGWQEVRCQKFAPKRDEFRAGGVGGRQRDIFESGVVAIQRDVERIHRFVEEGFEMLLPEGFIGVKKAWDEGGFAQVGDGFGGAGNHEAEGIEHGNRADEKHEVDEGDECPCLGRFTSDVGKNGHGVLDFPQCGKIFSIVWKNGENFFHTVENFSGRHHGVTLSVVARVAAMSSGVVRTPSFSMRRAL